MTHYNVHCLFLGHPIGPIGDQSHTKATSSRQPSVNYTTIDKFQRVAKAAQKEQSQHSEVSHRPHNVFEQCTIHSVCILFTGHYRSL